MEEALDLFLLGDRADLSGIRPALLALLPSHLPVGEALVRLPLDGASDDIFQDGFVLGEQVGHLVLLGQDGVGEEGIVGREMEGQFEAEAVGEGGAGDVGKVIEAIHVGCSGGSSTGGVGMGGKERE